jgi:type II secretion system protein H
MKKLALSPRAQHGFTLIEMMVVVALVAILAALAMPSFTTMIANQRVSSAAQELQTLLQLARAEGVYKRAQSTVTASAQTWQAKIGTQVLREATLADTVTVEPGSSGGVIFEVTGQAKPASGGGTSYTVSFSGTNASRVQCLTVTGAGLVRLKSAATTQACS